MLFRRSDGLAQAAMKHRANARRTSDLGPLSDIGRVLFCRHVRPVSWEHAGLVSVYGHSLRLAFRGLALRMSHRLAGDSPHQKV